MSYGHSGKPATIRESNHGYGVCKEHYAQYYVPKSSILIAGFGVWTISSVACGFGSFKIDYSEYSKSLISRIIEVKVFSIKYRYSDILLKKKHKLYLSRFLAAITLVIVLTWFLFSVTLYNIIVPLSPALSK